MPKPPHLLLPILLAMLAGSARAQISIEPDRVVAAIEFKARLGELIAELHPVLVLDIHGSNAFRPYDIDLGTMHGQSVGGDPAIVPQLAAALRGAGLVNVSDNRFPAASNRTITRYAHARGVPAVQLEFSVTRTSPQDGPLAGHLFAQALEGLARFLDVRGRCTRTTTAAAAEP